MVAGTDLMALVVLVVMALLGQDLDVGCKDHEQMLDSGGRVNRLNC
jgi:hypothetical protein